MFILFQSVKLHIPLITFPIRVVNDTLTTQGMREATVACRGVGVKVTIHFRGHPIIKLWTLLCLFRLEKNTVPSDPKEALVKFSKDIFHTVCIAYRLLLTLAFSIASCER